MLAKGSVGGMFVAGTRADCWVNMRSFCAAVAAAMVLVLGCGTGQRREATAIAVATPAAAATATSPLPRTTAATATSAPPPIAAPSAPSPTAVPEAAPFQVVVDGQPITADSLPSPQQYYAQLLVAHGKDLSGCKTSQAAQPGSCPKPSSLGSIDLKQQINIELILDDSGSMAEQIGGESKLSIAKRVFGDFLGTLPKNANVALRVLGERGSSADADKSASCASSDLLYPFQPLDTGKFQQAIAGFQPAGWTPLATTFDQAQQDFAQFDPASSSNFVYVITDGIETCDGDPVAAAQALHGTGVQPIINIVGFDVDQQAADQLRQAAEAGGGTFYSAQNADELNKIFQSNYDWRSWTAYYNCRYAAALQQYNATASGELASYNCYAGGILQEYNAVFDDALRRYNSITAAALHAINDYDARYSSNLAADNQAHQHYDALMARVQANYDYASQQESARYDRVANATQAEYDSVMGQASTEYEAAVAEVDQERQSRPQP